MVDKPKQCFLNIKRLAIIYNIFAGNYEIGPFKKR